MSFFIRCGFVLLLGLCSVAKASETVWVQTTPATPADLGVPDAIQAKCGSVGLLLGRYVLDVLVKRGHQTGALEGVQPDPADSVLGFELLGVTAPEDTGWSGGKGIVVRATVRTNETILASRIFALDTGGGAFYGVCLVISSAIETVAKQIGAWYSEGARHGFVGFRMANAVPMALLAPATFANPDDVPAAVLAECRLDTLVVNRTLAQLIPHFPDVTTTADEGNVGQRRVLRLTIADVVAPPGGSMSGVKSLRVKATLFEPGMGTTSSQEFEAKGGRGGPFGQVFKSACRVLDEVSILVARRTAAWVIQQAALAATALRDKQREALPAGPLDAVGLQAPSQVRHDQ